MTTLDLLKTRREEVYAIAHRHGVASLRVFGSVARGDDQQGSDVDLLVTTGAVVSAWFPAGLMIELEQLLGRPVDVVTEPGLNPLLREQVLAEAVAL